MSITVLGFVCRDRNTLPGGKKVESVGGKGYFTGAAIDRLGLPTHLITWLTDADHDLLDAFADYNLDIQVIPMSSPSFNTNDHVGDTTVATQNFDPRTIEPTNLDDEMRAALQQSQRVYLAPDIQEKISLATIKYIANDLGLHISADLGKYLRQRLPDGTMIPKESWPEQADYLQYFDTVFLSEEDIEPWLQRGESLLSIARGMSDDGPDEVIITRGSKGSFVYQKSDNDAIDVPSVPPPAIVDTTGAGDTYIGAYIFERIRSDNPHQAAKFASMAASLKLAYTGPLREDAAAVDAAIKRHEDLTLAHPAQ